MLKSLINQKQEVENLLDNNVKLYCFEGRVTLQYDFIKFQASTSPKKAKKLFLKDLKRKLESRINHKNGFEQFFNENVIDFKETDVTYKKDE